MDRDSVTIDGITYYSAPTGWTPDCRNPFAKDGTYGKKWTCCIVGRGERYGRICGSGKNSIFRHGEMFENPGLMSRLADYLRYENAHDRNPILSFPDDIDVDVFVSQALSETPPENVLRDSDQRWLVHSTNVDAWVSIQRDGALMAQSILLEEGTEILSVGFNQLEEPQEFSEYVMLGSIENEYSEYIVASQQKGKIYTKADAPYIPGVRLYFDNHMIIESGLGTRDGMHRIKVYKRLPLSPFLVAAIGEGDIECDKKVEEWTPRLFWRAANTEFFARV